MISYVLGITFALAEPYVAVLQSDSYIEYKTPTSSFLKKLQYKVKAFDLHGDREIALRRIKELKKRKPKVIFAVGAKAAWITRKHLPDIPMVYAMVRDPDKFGLDGDNVISVQMNPPKDLAMSHLQLFIPEAKNVVFFSSSKNNNEVNEYVKIAKEFGLSPTQYITNDTASLRKILKNLPDRIDAIWLSSDPELITPENFYHINNAAILQGIPLVTTSTYLAQAGAFLSVSSDYESVGILAAEVTQRLLAGETALLDTNQVSQQAFITLNIDTQKAIDIEIEPFMLDFVDHQIRE